jgi:predicted nucleic acid-binding protein
MYLDTAILVKLLLPEADSLYYARLAHGQLVYSSEIALTECHSAMLRKERERVITGRQRRAAWKQLQDDIAGRRINLLPVTRAVREAANHILTACQPRIPLRSLDAIHLGAAQEIASWPLCTADIRMREAAEKLGFLVTPLPAGRSDPRG